MKKINQNSLVQKLRVLSILLFTRKYGRSIFSPFGFGRVQKAFLLQWQKSKWQKISICKWEKYLIPQLLFDRIIALKEKFSRYLLSWKKGEKIETKKKKRLKWPTHFQKKTSRPLSSPCPCYVLSKQKL